SITSTTYDTARGTACHVSTDARGDGGINTTPPADSPRITFAGVDMDRIAIVAAATATMVDAARAMGSRPADDARTARPRAAPAAARARGCTTGTTMRGRA